MEISVDIDLSDYEDRLLEELSDEDLLEELENRNVLKKKTIETRYLMDFTDKDKAKRYLCDIMNENYTISNELLLKRIKEFIQ